MTQSKNITPQQHFECETLVIGAGIAGCWTALKLIEQGIKTIIAFYHDHDRGGPMGSTQLSAGAISTAPLLRDDYSDWLAELGREQVNSSVADITSKYLQEELNQLREFDPLRQIDLGLALASGSAKTLIQSLLFYLEKRGVRIIRDAWIFRIDASETECRGVQFQSGSHSGTIAASSIVIASGGYSGLFQGSVKTGTFGSIHGRFLQAGGKLSNLEFIFKHGYGQPDLGKLTPTEELPGVEIYDESGQHVYWLEEELFYGRGTHNHFQAFMTWRREESKKHYVDFRYCEFHRQLKNFLALTRPEGFHFQQQHFSNFDKYIDEEYRKEFFKWLISVVQGLKNYDFAEFNNIKPWLRPNCPPEKHRIRQIAYFSMGGIMHHGFLTNLRNIFVNGEAMHDYGAHRVGGLPWALYLCAARKIAEDILNLKQRKALVSEKPAAIAGIPHFDKQMLQDIQLKLASLENGKTESQLRELLNWFQETRKTLASPLDDSYAYLLMGEAIIQSATIRKESRGCFFRPDYIQEDYRLSRSRTIVSFNPQSQQIRADIIDKTHIFDQVLNRTELKEKIYGLTEKNNAAYFLLKKHLTTNIAQSKAVIEDSQSWTYCSLNDLVDNYAFFLFSQGLVRGDRVAIHLCDSANWIALFLASLQLGLVAVPINTFAKEIDVMYFLEDSGAELLISERNLLANLDFDLLSRRLATRIISIEDIHPLPQGRISCCVPVERTSPGFILYTSGSTGSPKGAIHSHADLEFTAQHFAREMLEPEAGDKFYSTSRLFFAYGLGNSLTFPLYFGCTAVLRSKKLNELETIKLLQHEKVNYLFSIPSIYNKLVDVDQFDLSSLKLSVSAGEPLAPGIAKQWSEKTSRPLLDGIGSTETLHIFCCNIYFPDGKAVIGKVVLGYKMKLLDDNNFAIDKSNVPGNLAVSGGSLAGGYWKNPLATKQSFLNDLVLTGDRYCLNSRSEYIYMGRKGDMYKVAGLWVSAIEVEMALKELSYLCESAMICFLTAEKAQKTAAFIVGKPSFEEGIATRVFNDLPKYLSRHKLPDYLFICSELPRTTTGKIIKSKLTERAEQYFQKQPGQASDELCFNIMDTEAV